MHPSRPLRRLSAVLATLVGLAIAQAAPAHAVLTGGDRGSGPPVALPYVTARTSGVKWSDVPKTYWARTAIDYVGSTNDWMLDSGQAADGTYAFEPDTLESRKLFARTLVRAFAPATAVDPTITFNDLPNTDNFYDYANIVVQLGWMQTDADGNFLPEDPVTTRMVHRALVLALGLGDVAANLDGLHTHGGYAFDTPKDFGTLLLGMRLGLRYNHDDESLDVGPDSPLPRAEVAWSLYRATTEDSWTTDSLRSQYLTMELPNLGMAAKRIVQFGIDYVGYPYVWGGEWYQPSPTGYCCGAQPVGGFDCSGITWFVMRAASGTWDPTPPRTYRGWSLPQRTSTDMASAGGKIRFKALEPGDLMFYDGDGDGVVDHVDVYIGNGFSLDSSSSYAGVSIVYTAEGWYRDHFVHGRRLIG